MYHELKWLTIAALVVGTLLGLLVTQLFGNDMVELATCEISATDQEQDEGYFACGQALALVWRLEASGHFPVGYTRLRQLKGRTVVLQARPE